jgi:hypothetical protein
LLGALLFNFGLQSLIALFVRFPHGPNWNDFIDEARLRARRYEEYQVTYPALQPTTTTIGNRRGPSHKVSSPKYGEHLWAEVRDRERQKGEVQFRMTLSVAAVLPAVALVVRGGWLWLLCLLPSVLLWLDQSRLQDATRNHMNSVLRTEVVRDLQAADERIAELEKRAANQTANTDDEEELARRRSEREQLVAKKLGLDKALGVTDVTTAAVEAEPI